jgi:hypothetical protein
MPFEARLMRKLLWLLLLLVPTPALADVAALNGFCDLGASQAAVQGLPSTNYQQGNIPQCTITVYLTGTTTLATIYSDGSSDPLSNPFTASTKGQWLFFAAVNQGYDVVGSGGIAPNTYATPVTLCTGCFPATQVITSSGVTQIVAGTNITVSPSGGTGVVTVNAPNSLTLQHNGTNLADQNLLNFNDATPAAPSGFNAVTFQADGSGNLSGYTPTSAPRTAWAGLVTSTQGSADTTLAVTLGSGTIPTNGGYLLVNSEWEKFTGVTSLGGGLYTLTGVTRGQYVTTAASHSTNANIVSATFAVGDPSQAMFGFFGGTAPSGGTFFSLDCPTGSNVNGTINFEVGCYPGNDTFAVHAGSVQVNSDQQSIFAGTGGLVVTPSSSTISGAHDGINNAYRTIQSANTVQTVLPSQFQAETGFGQGIAGGVRAVQAASALAPILYDDLVPAGATTNSYLCTGTDFFGGNIPGTAASIGGLASSGWGTGKVDIWCPYIPGAVSVSLYRTAGVPSAPVLLSTATTQPLSFSDGLNTGSAGSPNASNTSFAPFASAEAAAPAGASGVDYLWGSSTAHRLMENANNAGSVILSGVAAAGTSGHCPQFAVNGIDLVDSGAACGGGGGSGTVNSGTANFFAFYPATGAAVSSNPHLDDGATTAGTITSAEPIAVNTGTGQGGTFSATEGTAATAAAGKDILYADSTAHCMEYSANGGAFSCLGGGGGGVTWPTAGQVVVSNGTSSPAGLQHVLYASQITGVTPGVAVVPGSSATSTTDSAGPINTAIAAGNVDLEVDSGFALSTSLVLASNTTIHCTSPQYGFIMQAAANAPVLMNLHQNAPTTASGTGGFLVSNQADSNITVKGCTLNANSTQAVTGNNAHGTPHVTNPGTGLWVNGLQFVGVIGLNVLNDDVYDSGAFSLLGSNDTRTHVDSSYFHQPSPTVAFKNTDGPHWIGPDNYIWVTNNRIASGDDALAFDPDDGNRTGSGDPNFTYTQWPGVKWGPIQQATADTNNIDGSFFGVRVYTATELADGISFNNTSGYLCGNTGTLEALSAIGTGNMGTIKVNGWNVQTDGTCNNYGQVYNFILTSNFKNIQISNVQVTNPGVNWPLLSQTAGTCGTLGLRNWDLNTQTSSFSNVVNLTGGTPCQQIAASGINWNDAVTNTGYLFAGTAVPSTITLSNYAGPNRVLGPGFAPIGQNGDAFTNVYGIIYVATTFNEAASTTALAGTTPVTCTNGCTGPWTLAAGTDFTYQSGGGVSTSTANGANPDLIIPGVLNYVVRANVASCTPGSGECQLAIRYTDINNFTAINIKTGNIQIFDVVGGTATQKGSTLSGAITGNYTVTVNGSTISLIAPNGTSTSGTISNTTGTKVGFLMGTGATLYKISSYSVKSQ